MKFGKRCSIAPKPPMPQTPLPDADGQPQAVEFGVEVLLEFDGRPIEKLRNAVKGILAPGIQYFQERKGSQHPLS